MKFAIVRGRGKSFSHKAVDHSQDDEGRPVVSLDYGFFGSPGELPADAVGGQKMPVLVVRDRFTKAIFSHLVPAKGTEHYYPEIALLRDQISCLHFFDFENRSTAIYHRFGYSSQEHFVITRYFSAVGEQPKRR